MISIRLVPLLLTTIGAHAVLAQPAGAGAEVLFRQGRELMAAGKLAEACAAFAESQKLDPAVTTLLNLGACRENNRQLATAWGVFLDAERETRRATDAEGQKLHEIALEHARRLEPRVSKLTIVVNPDQRLAGLEIYRDTEHLDSVQWNRALPIDGGTLTIRATAPGAVEWTTTITVEPEGDAKSVEVPKLARAPVKPPPIAVVRPAPTRTRSSKLPPVAVGVGAIVLLGGGLGVELWASSTYNAAKDELTDQSRRDSLYGKANTQRYAAEGLAAGGLACAGVALWLALRGGEDRPNFQLVPTASGVVLVGSY